MISLSDLSLVKSNAYPQPHWLVDSCLWDSHHATSVNIFQHCFEIVSHALETRPDATLKDLQHEGLSSQGMPQKLVRTSKAVSK